MWTSPNCPEPPDCRLAQNRFTIRNLGFFGVDFDLVASLELFLQDGQVKFRHTGNNEFLGLNVLFAAEGGVFFAQFRQRNGQFAFVAAAFGSGSQRNHRGRKVNGGQISVAD